MTNTHGMGWGFGDYIEELFVPWIYKIMLAYQEQKDHENDIILPKNTKFSKTYYTKKVNQREGENWIK